MLLSIYLWFIYFYCFISTPVYEYHKLFIKETVVCVEIGGYSILICSVLVDSDNQLSKIVLLIHFHQQNMSALII